MPSIRAQILTAIEALYTSVTPGQPVDDPYTLEWGEVTRKPIKSLGAGRRAIMGVYPTREEKTGRAGIVMDCRMQVVLEMHLNRDLEDLEDLLETALREAERRLMEDQTLGGLCLDITVRETDTNVDGAFSNAASVSLFVDIRYQHHRDDPGRLVGD